MLTLQGRVINCFKKLAEPNAKTGEVFDPKPKVQILGETPLKGGGVEMSTTTLSVTDLPAWDKLKGQVVRVYVAQWFSDKGGDGGLYVLKGTTPEVIKA